MRIDWEKIRETEFPALKNVVYLKAAGGAPISKTAYQEGVNYLNEMLFKGDIFWDNYFNKLNLIRKNLAYYINAKPDEIAFLTNTSSCMNIAARLLPIGEILFPEEEFPSSIHAFKRLGFNCRKVKHQNHHYKIDEFKKKLRDDSKYIVHSHVQYLTGFKQNIEKLGLFSAENNLINIINATQSFGAFPIDVKKQNIKILAASALKWLCCGYGIGIFYVNKTIIDENNLSFSSWLSVNNAFSMDNENLDLINKTSSLDGLGGTPNFPALLILKGGLKLIEDIGDGNIQRGIKAINERIIELTSEFINEVRELNFKIITPLELENRSGIITLEHDKAEAIYYELKKNNIYISLRNYPKSTKKTLLRFSFNYYNNLDDIKKSISILKGFN